MPTKLLEVCRPAVAFVPLGIYSLLFLLLTSHPVATMALPSLCWSLFLAGGWGGREGDGKGDQKALILRKSSCRQTLKGMVQGTNGKN